MVLMIFVGTYAHEFGALIDVYAFNVDWLLSFLFFFFTIYLRQVIPPEHREGSLSAHLVPAVYFSTIESI